MIGLNSIRDRHAGPLRSIVEGLKFINYLKNGRSEFPRKFFDCAGGKILGPGDIIPPGQ